MPPIQACHLVDWMEAADPVYANRAALMKASRDQLFSLLGFMFGFAPYDEVQPQLSSVSENHKFSLPVCLSVCDVDFRMPCSVCLSDRCELVESVMFVNDSE